MSSRHDENRLANVVEQLLDASDADSRAAFKYRREILDEVRNVRLQLDRIEAKLFEPHALAPAAPAKPTTLQTLAGGGVPVAWFTASGKFLVKRVLPHVLAAAGGGWLAHALRLFG